MPARKPLPPRRTTGRRVARPSLAARLIGGSTAFLAKIGAPIVARPVLSASIAGVAVLFGFVSGNAFYAQPSRHPHPMMTTRGEMPVLAGNAEADEGLMAVPLVLEVQTLLARTGHYTAALDGKPGKATAAAIRAFQTEYALRVDGEPSTQLLRQIDAHLQVADAAPAVPVAVPAPERFASIEPGDASDPAPTGSTSTAATSPERDLVRKIQNGLTHADVAKLDADGIPGERTREAIRTFEALEGLDVTGNPDKRILERLISIGAVQ